MPKYVVKNSRGGYLCQRSGPSFWDANRDDRWSTRNRAVAFERAKRVMGRVYRVRSVAARREREAILDLLVVRRDMCKLHSVEWCELDFAIQEIEARGKHAER